MVEINTVQINRNSPPLNPEILLNQGGAVLDDNFDDRLYCKKIKGGTLDFFSLKFQNS